MKTTKRSLLKSVLALLLCFCMLLGTTFAWFTDLVTSNANKIQAGFLKIDLELLNEKTGKWKSLKNNSDPIFDYDRWEPGYTDVKILKVENEGTLALKWIAKFVSEDQLSILADVIDVYVCPSDTEIGYPADRSLEGYTKVGNLKKFINTIEKTTYGTLEAEECSYLGIALKMQESAGNEYQGLSLGGAFDIRIYATQWNGEDESDSFDNQYDKDATYPPMLETLKTYADITYKVDENNRLTEEVRLYDRSNGVLATLPVGTLIEDGATQVVLQIDGDEVDPKLVLDLRVGYDVNVEGVDPTNDKPIVILLPKVLTSNQLGVELYHEGNAMTRVYTPEALLEKQGDNDTYGDKYIYDDATGDVTVSVTHFSNISLGATESIKVNGAAVNYDAVIDLNNYVNADSVTVPADGKTYLLTWNSGDMSVKNALDGTITHTWYNINPGTYFDKPIKLEKGAKVILQNVNVRTSAADDAIELVNTNATEDDSLTYIYVADGTQNWLTGKSGIGFGTNSANYSADLYVEGAGNLYATAIGSSTPAIGVDSASDGNLSKMHFNVGFLRSIPMNGAAGIGTSAAEQLGLGLIEFNGGTYQSYNGGDSASIGAGKNGSCGEIIVNAGSTVYCYNNTWSAYGRNMGCGIYEGSCSGIYVSKDAYVYGWNAQTGAYGEWTPNTPYVPSGREQDAAIIVESFTDITKITYSKTVAGELVELKADFGGIEVELDVSKCKFNGTSVSVCAVYENGTVYYLSNGGKKAETTVDEIVTITSIEPLNVKPAYYVGDELVISLKVNYSDDSFITLTEGFEVTGFDSSDAGTNEITVTYKDKVATFTLTIEAIAPARAEVTTNPDKTEYFEGEDLDFTGMVITVYNNNGTFYTVEGSEFYTNYDKNRVGEQVVEITVDGVKATITVTVKEILLDSIEVIAPTKKDYYAGDELDLAGMTVTAVYNNGDRIELNGGYEVIGNTNGAGQQTVTVNYNGKTATFTINVTPVVAEGIEIVNMPGKVTYYEGDALDTTGLTIKVTYNNGTSSEAFATGFTTSGYDPDTVGSQTITVSYNGMTTTFTVVVNEVVLDSIEVIAPTKKDYYVGDELDLAGMTVIAVYNNGDRIELNGGYEVIGDTSVAGQQIITVKYDGKEATFTINVTPVVANGIEIVTMPDKVRYYEGDALDTTGLTIKVTYNNGTSSEAFATGFTTSGYDKDLVATQTITVAYEGMEATFTVNVIAIEVDRIEIDTYPTKTNYKIGEQLDFAGLTIKVIYNNGNSEVITDGFDVSGFDNTNGAAHTVTVSYTENNITKTVTFDVTPILPDRAEIIAGNEKTTYTAGESFDPSGIVLKVYYTDGTSEEISEGLTVDAPATLVVGTHTVTVSYAEGGKTVSDTFTVTVESADAFMYRLGNQNNVTTAQIATMLTGEEHNGTNVTVEKYVGEVSYSNNRFTGTGVVNVTVDDKSYYVEIVNAYNLVDLTERHGSAGGKNWVLIKDLTYTNTDTVTISNMSWYGNGLTVDFSEFDGAYNEQFIINASNVRFDNIQLVGPVYEKAYVYQEDANSAGDIEYYRSLIQAGDGTEILNSFVSGARTPVRINDGTVTITNSTISGGSVANIDVKGGALNLNNVTTINQGTDVVGYGIFIDNDGGVKYEATIDINGLTSYNWLTADDADNMKDPTSSNYMDNILTSILETKGASSVNFSLIYLNDLEGIKITGVATESETISNKSGRLYSDTTTNGKQVPEYVPDAVAPVVPEFVWSDKLDNGKYSTSFEEGGSTKLPDGLLTATKFGKTLDVEIISGTTEYKDLAIGTHIFAVTYKITDPYIYGEDGESLNPEYYELTLEVNVTVTPKEVVAPDFIFMGMNNSASYEGIKVDTANDDVKYITAVQTETDGFKKVATQNGTAIYAPIVEVYDIISYSGSTTKYRRAVPVFGGVTVQADNTIIADSNLGGTALPDGFAWVTGNDGDNNYLDMAAGWESYQTNENWAVKGDYSGLMRVTKAVSSKTWEKNYTDAGGERDFVIEYTYSGEDGITYHYYICYRGDSGAETGEYNTKSCVTGDTLVALADGTQKRIDQVTYEDQLLVWNFYEGKYDVAPAALVQNHGYSWNNVIKLTFSDGTVIKVVNEHGYFDAALNEFVMITSDNATEYIGHEFVKEDGESYTTVTLVSADVSEEYIEAYSILTAYYYNFFTNRMFSLTSPVIETNFFMPFEVGEDMTFDAEKMANDIAEYGLYEYSDFEGQIPYEVFEALNIKYLKVAVGKGLITYDQIIKLLKSEGVVE